MQVTAIHPDVFSIFTNVLLIFTKIRCTGNKHEKSAYAFQYALKVMVNVVPKKAAWRPYPIRLRHGLRPYHKAGSCGRMWRASCSLMLWLPRSWKCQGCPSSIAWRKQCGGG